MPPNQPALRAPTRGVTVDVRFGTVLQVGRIEFNTVKAPEGTPHLVDGQVMDRRVLQRSTPKKAYIESPRVIRARIQVSIRRDHTSDANGPAQNFSGVIVSAHEPAIVIQTKPGTELLRDKRQIAAVGLKSGHGDDELFGNNFLRKKRECADQ